MFFSVPVWLWLLALFLVSAALRFWRLAQFNELVFDEVHFVRFANDYLTHTQFFENHPPLGAYFISIGIWLGHFYPFQTTNDLLGTPLAPFGYRWMNAFIGSFVPLLAAALAWQISGRKRLAVLAGLFAAMDGMALVESRYALINIYILFFGLLGQIVFLAALRKTGRQRNLGLLLAGILLGGAFSVKWSGLAFLLGILGLFTLAKLATWQKFLTPAQGKPLPLQLSGISTMALSKTSITIMVSIVAAAFLFYWVIWFPHLDVNDNMDFWGWQKYMLDSQNSVGGDVHPYCSRWYTWPELIRPVSYYFHATPNASGGQNYQAVHSLGNPVLWWLSSLSILAVLGFVFQRLVLLTSSFVSAKDRSELFQSPGLWVGLFLVVNYGANLLPWLGIGRCTFLYHYLPASYFSMLALAWIVDNGLSSSYRLVRIFAWLCPAVVLAGFVYWLPIYLGISMPSEEFYKRMLLGSWI